MRMKLSVRNLFFVAIAFFCATRLSCGQALGPTVEIPTTKTALINIGSNANQDATMAGEYKATKNVVEAEKPIFWTWFTDVGYTSEYNFRGTDLMPNSDGGAFFDARVTKWNFTLGLFGIHQLGTASVPSWSIGEGGGAAGAAGGNATSIFGPVPYTRFPTTTQTRFNELDVFLSHKFTLGPIDVTIGNIGFFIDRQATTSETDVLPPLFHGLSFVWAIPPTFTKVRTLGPDPTVEDEQFDRLYITLSTTKISKYITPQITYYQTIHNAGSQPTHDGTLFYAPDINGNIPQNPRPFNERNTSLGGYLEGRINTSFPITSSIDFNPYGILSVSFKDRTEPGGSNPYGGKPLTGFNHAQIGLEVPIHLLHLGGSSSTPWAPPDAHLYLVPFGAYSYHISNPPPGTDRNEAWGGGKFELTF